MFGNKKLLNELKEIKKELKKVNIKLTDLRFNVKTENVEPSTKKSNKESVQPVKNIEKTLGGGSPIYKYYENNLDKINVVLKPNHQSNVDRNNRGFNSYTLSVLATLLKKGYSKEKIAKTTGVKLTSIAKYLSLGKKLGYFGGRRSVGNNVVYFPIMSYFDTI